jgi:phenylalanyl-tRNA synthetase beta chain
VEKLLRKCLIFIRQPLPKKTIVLNYDYLDTISGIKLDKTVSKNILQSLGFEIKSEKADSLIVEVPYHKTDVAVAADLAEEILRIYGYSKFLCPIKSATRSPDKPRTRP